jgi:hypothetical protein
MEIQFKATDFDVKGALYYQLSRNRSLGEFVHCYQSEKRKNHLENGMHWKPKDFALKELVRNDLTRLLKIEIYLFNKRGEDQLLGKAEFCLNDVIRDNINQHVNVYLNKVPMGKIETTLAKEWNKYQFIDYIHGGMTVSLFVAIDFSLGNKHPSNPFSLHYINEDLNMEESDSDLERRKRRLARKSRKLNTLSQA